MNLLTTKSSTANRVEQGMATSSRSFKTGESDNTAGRLKVLSEVGDLVLEHAGKAIETLVSIMCNEITSAAARS